VTRISLCARLFSQQLYHERLESYLKRENLHDSIHWISGEEWQELCDKLKPFSKLQKTRLLNPSTINLGIFGSTGPWRAMNDKFYPSKQMDDELIYLALSMTDWEDKKVKSWCNAFGFAEYNKLAWVLHGEVGYYLATFKKGGV
jgi:hypothetical protein